MIVEDDSVLVSECLRGDRKAFEVIVERYQKPVFNLALRIVNDYDDAQDVAQSAFVKAFENLKSYNPKYKFFSWLYRIAINESLNFVGQRQNLQRLDEAEVSKELSPEETLDTAINSQAVQDALMKLKLEHRVVIILKHFQELSYREISYILDLPEKTVKSRLFTAREQLRRVLLRKAL
jgi:RNA polymerase sigma-70 factor (ECF subfamily)